MRGTYKFWRLAGIRYAAVILKGLKTMNAKEILNKQFEKAKIGGYKIDVVDDFLREVSDEFAQLQKSNSELERKLEVLADKIREYREDEDALKDALLIAQKQGNAIVAESKASAEKLTKETNAKVEKLLSESKAKSEKLINDADAYSRKTRSEADAAAEKTIGNANTKAAEIKAAIDKQQTIQENILQQTRKEVIEYTEKVLSAYNAQIELIKGMPEKCENEYVKRISEEVEKRETERRKLEEQKAAKSKAEAVKNAAAQQKAKEASAKASTVKAEENAKAKSEKTVKSEKTSSEFGGAATQKSVSGKQPKPPKNADSVKANEKTAENNLPFFNSDAQAITRHDNLQFGKHSDKKN